MALYPRWAVVAHAGEPSRRTIISQHDTRRAALLALRRLRQRHKGTAALGLNVERFLSNWQWPKGAGDDEA